MKHILIPILFIAIIASVIYFFVPKYKNLISTDLTSKSTDETQNIPKLSLPFHVDSLLDTQAEVNPLGVVRFSKDLSSIGHSGIDFPMKEKSEIYAVADGEIVLIDSTGDDWGGMKVFELLKKTGKGEGIGFIYDHVTPVSGLKVGDKVTKGQYIANKVAPNDFTSHFQMSKLFNNYEYIDGAMCWIDYLSEEEKTKLDSWWNVYKNSDHLLGSWRGTIQEGKYPLRGLLDKENFPDGPQFCYPLGTDVR